MRFNLAELKKSVTRRNGELHVIPYLLRSGELAAEVDALIALYEAWLGQSRATFPEDRPVNLIGDYRLARSLVLCLSDWYIWEMPDWGAVAGEREAAILAARGITSSSQLRLALYDFVNASTKGYLPAAQREAALESFAATCGIARATLDDLLWLDADERAVLHRTSETIPASSELAVRYNQRAVETLLANASRVEWLVPPEVAAGSGGGLGTVVKRICFLARRMGVHYDIAFDTGQLEERGETTAGSFEKKVAEQRGSYSAFVSDTTAQPELEVPKTLNRAEMPLRITLYGPQEVMGAPNQYGERLAWLCRALLGYRRQLERGQATLRGKGLQGTAQVYLYGRPATFVLDGRLLKLLSAEGAAGVRGDGAETTLESVAFDSALERRLHEEFNALARASEAHGWRLEREPEPVIVEDTILVPDFALTREARRVYLEIAGYWRPGYRERKARKLAALRGHVALIVAAPQASRAEFATVVDDFPMLWYKDYVSAHAVLGVLERAFNDFSQRLATLDCARVLAEVESRGRIPSTESLALLHSYTRTELAEAVHRLEETAVSTGQSTPQWVEGVGLCAGAWCAARISALRGWIYGAPDKRLPLSELRGRLASGSAGLADVTESAVEALASLAGLVTLRTSIFEPVVMAAEVAAETARIATQPAKRPQRSQPHKAVRRKVHKTSIEPQSLFASERAGDGDSDPNTPTQAT